MNNLDVNFLLNKYTSFVDSISFDYGYDNNLKHLLYFIVPSFIIKYGILNEKMILKVFRDVRVIVSSKEDDRRPAYFTRTLRKENGKIVIYKYIVLDKYKTASLSELLDSIIHEFCHAINSYNNEIVIDDSYVKLRTGVSYLIYDKETLKFIKKSNENILEEVLNTINTEDVVNIIKSFSKYNLSLEYENMVYSLNSITSVSFESLAYSFEKYICKILVNNKTFIPTINNLRFKGYIQDIPNLFDNITGIDGSYDELNNNLFLIHELENKYTNSKFFKKRILNKIRTLSKKVIDIINLYDSKCIYK